MNAPSSKSNKKSSSYLYGINPPEEEQQQLFNDLYPFLIPLIILHMLLLIITLSTCKNIKWRHKYENYIKERINNETGVGVQGLGGNTTAFDVFIETYPCHIASLPVAVNLNCHAARKAKVVL